jgi:hypothetical protein
MEATAMGTITADRAMATAVGEPTAFGDLSWTALVVLGR